MKQFTRLKLSVLVPVLSFLLFCVAAEGMELNVNDNEGQEKHQKLTETQNSFKPQQRSDKKKKNDDTEIPEETLDVRRSNKNPTSIFVKSPSGNISETQLQEQQEDHTSDKQRKNKEKHKSDKKNRSLLRTLSPRNLIVTDRQPTQTHESESLTTSKGKSLHKPGSGGHSLSHTSKGSSGNKSPRSLQQVDKPRLEKKVSFNNNNTTSNQQPASSIPTKITRKRSWGNNLHSNQINSDSQKEDEEDRILSSLLSSQTSIPQSNDGNSGRQKLTRRSKSHLNLNSNINNQKELSTSGRGSLGRNRSNTFDQNSEMLPYNTNPNNTNPNPPTFRTNRGKSISSQNLGIFHSNKRSSEPRQGLSRPGVVRKKSMLALSPSDSGFVQTGQERFQSPHNTSPLNRGYQGLHVVPEYVIPDNVTIDLNFDDRLTTKNNDNITNLPAYSTAVAQEDDKQHHLANFNYDLAYNGKKDQKNITGARDEKEHEKSHLLESKGSLQNSQDSTNVSLDSAEGQSSSQAKEGELSLPPQSAVVLYGDKHRYAKVMTAVDKSLLQRVPGGGLFFGGVGAVLLGYSTPLSINAINLNMTGNLLHVPYDAWLSISLSAVFMTTLTQVALVEGKKFGQVISQTIWQTTKDWCSCCFQAKPESVSFSLRNGLDYTWEIGRKQAILDYVMKVAAGPTALYDALKPEMLLILSWSRFYPEFTPWFAPFFFARNFCKSYDENLISSRRFFKYFRPQEPKKYKLERQVGDSQIQDVTDTQLKNAFFKDLALDLRPADKYLLHGIKGFQDDLDDSLVEEAYQRINYERDIVNDLSINPKKHFAASILLYKPVQNEDGRLSHDNIDTFLDQSAEHEARRPDLEEVLGYLKTVGKCTFISGKILCKGASTLISEPIIAQMTLELFWNYFLPGSSSGMTWGFTGAFALLNLMKECPNLIEECHNFMVARKTIEKYPLREFLCDVVYPIYNFRALVSAGFWSLIGVELGVQSLNRWSFSSGWGTFAKTITMTPYVVDKFFPEYRYLTTKLSDFYVEAVTTVPETATRISGSISHYMPNKLKKGWNLVSGCCASASQCIPACPSMVSQGASVIWGWALEKASTFQKRCWLEKWSEDLKNCVEFTWDITTKVVFYQMGNMQEGEPVEEGVVEEEPVEEQAINIIIPIWEEFTETQQKQIGQQIEEALGWFQQYDDLTKIMLNKRLESATDYEDVRDTLENAISEFQEKCNLNNEESEEEEDEEHHGVSQNKRFDDEEGDSVAGSDNDDKEDSQYFDDDETEEDS